jgi:hypothetical protein
MYRPKSPTVRWLVHDATHAVYEVDGDCARTLCGEILSGGRVMTCTAKSAPGRKCQQCLRGVRERFKTADYAGRL